MEIVLREPRNNGRVITNETRTHPHLHHNINTCNKHPSNTLTWADTQLPKNVPTHVGGLTPPPQTGADTVGSLCPPLARGGHSVHTVSTVGTLCPPPAVGGHSGATVSAPALPHTITFDYIGANRGGRSGVTVSAPRRGRTQSAHCVRPGVGVGHVVSHCSRTGAGCSPGVGGWVKGGILMTHPYPINI